MAIEMKFAESAEEKEAVFRHRYEIYIEEMNRYRGIADHARRVMIEDVDENSRFYYATDDGVVVGSMRWTWGGDADFLQRHVDQYMLTPFIESMPTAHLIIGERFMITREYRGSDLLSRMFQAYMNFCNEKRVQLVFGDCEPHLLNLYLGLGFRTYSTHNINSPETGYLIPLVLVPEDIDYMRRIRSPMASVLQDFGGQHQVPANLDQLIAGSAVLSERLAQRESYWEGLSETFTMIGQGKFSLFDGLGEDVVQPFLEKSNVIQCMAGDKVLKQGNVAQNMFVILSGEVEIKKDDKVIARLKEGDLIGEIAFLLGIPRSADVFAAQDGTTVLSLSETTVRKHMEEDPGVAAQMMLNIAKILCQKLVT